MFNNSYSGGGGSIVDCSTNTGNLDAGDSNRYKECYSVRINLRHV